jgi:hypothetical protein
MLCLKEAINGLCICWKSGFCAYKKSCNLVVCFRVEEMDQETCEGFCEHY